MKLNEVLKPLLENKVDYLAQHHGEAIEAQLKKDRSTQLSTALDALQFMEKNVPKKQLQWVVKRYINGEFLLEEDIQVVAEALNLFIEHKNQLDKKDINQYQSLKELYNATHQFKELNIDDNKERYLIASGELEVVFEQGNERILIPRTEKASRYMADDRWGTEWCTRFPDNFKRYSDQGPLYMIDINDGEEVYQAHWESGEKIKDISDKEPSDTESLKARSVAVQWVIEQGKKRIENMDSGNPSWAAYNMVRNGYAEPEWVMKVIENTTTGNPPWAAFLMVRHGYTEPEWAMKLIENATTGDPSEAAYHMVRYKLAKPEWAMKVIENTTTDGPSQVARYMVDDGYAEPEWAMKVIENATSGDSSRAAYFMVKYGYAKPEWAKEFIENTTIGNPSWPAYLMVMNGLAEPEWAKEFIENTTIGNPSWPAYRMVRDGYATQEWFEEIKRKNQ